MEIAEIHNKVYDIGNIQSECLIFAIQPSPHEIQVNEQWKKWLSPPDVYQHHNSIHKAQHKGTGTWFFASGSKFFQWKQGKKKILWIYGKRVFCFCLCHTLSHELCFSWQWKKCTVVSDLMIQCYMHQVVEHAI